MIVTNPRRALLGGTLGPDDFPGLDLVDVRWTTAADGTLALELVESRPLTDAEQQSAVTIARGADDDTVAAVLDDPTSQARAVLAGSFAAQPTQAAVEAGRLADEVLSARFQQSRIFISANQLMAASGSPTLSLRGGFWPMWLLDSTLDEGVSILFTVPRSWATFDIVLRGVNASTGIGNVVFRTLHSSRGDGDDVTTGFTTGSNATLTAGAQNTRQSVTARTNIAADTTRTNVVRVMRMGSDANDTLPNDFGLTAVEIVAKTYVTFVPEPPETTPTAADNYFTKASNNNLAGLRVFQQAAPPADDTIDATYAYWPVTDAATMQNFTTSTWTGGNRWSFLWANRCNFGDAWNRKPNGLPAPTIKVGTQEARATYTTVTLANAATQSQIRYMLGNDATTYQAPWIAAGGSAGDFITDAALRANPGAYCTTDFAWASSTYKVMVDKVPLPAPRFVDGNRPDLQLGVVLDYEVQDSRTPATTQAFLESVAADVHAAGRQLFLYTNPFNATTQQYTGIDGTNLPAILAAVDHLSIFLWSGNKEGSVSTSYTNQVALLGTMTTALWAKLVINFELGNPGTSLADAQWVHNKLREAGTSHPGKVMFWRNYATQGGPGTTLTNQKIAAVVAP